MSNKNKILLFSLTFTLTLIIATTSNVFAETQWGIQKGIKYKFSLKKLYMGGDLTPFLKSNTTLEVEFTDLNDTGYSYDVFNSTGAVATDQSTIFVPVENEFGNFILPEGLPIALPLSIGEYSNYIGALASFINESAQNINFITDELDFNLTEIGSNITIAVYSTINTEAFNINLDFYADKLNSTLLETLAGSIDTGGLPVAIPTNITDFTMNVTLSYSITTGLFSDLKIKIRSKAIQYGFPSDFNVDVDYGQEVEQPSPTSTATTENNTKSSPFMAFWGIIGLLSLSVIFMAKHKGKI